MSRPNAAAPCRAVAAERHWACALEIIIAKEIILNSEKTTTKQNKHYTKKIEKLIVIYASIHYELHKNNVGGGGRAVAAERGRAMSGGGSRTRPRHVGRWRPRYVGRWRPNAAASCRAVAAAPCRVALMGHGRNFKFAQLVTEFVGLAYPAARGNKL